MHTYRSISWGLLISAMFLGSGCVLAAFSGANATKGSGVPKSEVRAVGAFTGLDLGGATQAEVTVGPAPSLKIETDDNLLAHVVTEVRDGTLHIYMKKPVSKSLGLKVWITTPRLASADVSGASELTVRGIRSEHLDLDLSGASQGTLEGEVGSLTLDLSGASQLDLRGLPARTATLDLSGASQAELCVSDTIRGSLSGASQARYGCGSPRLEVETSGAARVRKAG